MNYPWMAVESRGLSAGGLDDETRVFSEQLIGRAFITSLALLESRGYLEIESQWLGRGVSHADHAFLDTRLTTVRIRCQNTLSWAGYVDPQVSRRAG